MKFTAPGVIESLEALHTSSVTVPAVLIYASTAIPLYVLSDPFGVTIRVLLALVINEIAPVEVPQLPGLIADVGPGCWTMFWLAVAAGSW